MIKFLIPIIVIASFMIADTIEYYQYEAFRFLEFGIGARAIGMGNAVVASTNDPYSIYWNPARLTKIDGTAFSTSVSYLYNPESKSGKPFATFTKPQIALSYSLGDYGTIGLSGCYFNSGDDVKYLYAYEGINTDSLRPIYNESFLGMSYGNNVMRGLELGLSILLYQLTLPPNKFFSEKSEFAFSNVLGMNYELTSKISIALIYYNSTSIFSDTHSIFVVDTIIGDSIKLDTVNVEFRVPVKRKAVIGIAYSPLEKLLLELDIKTKESITPFKLYLGCEYSYEPFNGEKEEPICFKMRLGLRDLLGREKIGEATFSNHAFTAGFGFTYCFLPMKGSFDYAIIYRPNICGEKHFSHTLSFGVGIIF
ncbi:MAG: hypothetical protein ABIL02_00325 [candidate division WOR-3 bacterium]